MIRWVRTALIVYIILALASAILSYLSPIPLLDTDILEFLVIFFTSTQQVFHLIHSKGDIFFGYDSGFNTAAFILGAVVWALVAIFLWYISRNRRSTKEKLRYSGKTLMLLGSLLVVLVFFVAIFYLAEEYILFLLFISVMLVFMPVFLMGLVLYIYSKFL